MALVPAFSGRAGLPLGLTGAVSATRYVGGLASGAPVAGTFLAGDFVVNLDGSIYVCTVAGTPGTWVDTATIGPSVASVFGRAGTVVAVTGDYYGVVAAALTGATAASRYVGATASGAPVAGTFAVGDMVVDQTGKIWICTVAGTPGTWVGVGGLSAMVQIADTTLSSPAATFDFTSIPGTYNHLQILVQGRTAEAVIPSDFSIRFNGDSGSNYEREYHRGSLDSNEANHSGTTTSIPSLTIAGASAPANVAGSAVIWIPNYAGTTFHKSVNFQSGVYGGDGAAQSIVTHGLGRWNNTAAITRVTLQVQAGSNFATGSRATLYGLT